MAREIKSPEPTIFSAKSFDEKHEIQFNENSHRYKLDGKPAVGVTTFIKSASPTPMALISWMKGQTAEALFNSLTVPGENGYYPRESFWPVSETTKKDLIKQAKLADKEKAQEAADIGTICHGFAELHSLGRDKDAAELLERVRGAATWPKINACVEKYLDWSSHNKGRLIKAEGLIGSPHYKFCGKFDRLDDVDGKVILRDYKTSKGFYIEQYIQLAAYSIALEEWSDIYVAGLEVLRFGKDDGAFNTLLIDNFDEIEMFRRAAIRRREDYDFLKLEDDERFKWGGVK